MVHSRFLYLYLGRIPYLAHLLAVLGVVDHLVLEDNGFFGLRMSWVLGFPWFRRTGQDLISSHLISSRDQAQVQAQAQIKLKFMIPDQEYPHISPMLRLSPLGDSIDINRGDVFRRGRTRRERRAHQDSFHVYHHHHHRRI